MILYTENKLQFNSTKWNELFNGLPKSICNGISRFHKWQDKQASLLGKLLLQKAILLNSFPGNILENFCIDQYFRPYIPGFFDFNISHTEGLVVCAINPAGKIGIDVEKIKPLSFSDLNAFLTPGERNFFLENDFPNNFLLDCWTKKEAVLKAWGNGIANNLNDMDTQKSEVWWDKQSWNLSKIFLDDSYICHIASSQKEPSFRLQHESFI